MKNNPLSKCLIDGAADFIKRTGSPSDLLAFLNDTLIWISSCQRNEVLDPKKEDIFHVTVLIEHLVQPWYAHSANSDLVDHLADGISEIIDFFGEESYAEIIGTIMIATGYRWAGNPMFREFEVKHQSCLVALMDLYYPISQYAEEIRAEKANNTIHLQK